jgi:hypothetical protein
LARQSSYGGGKGGCHLDGVMVETGSEETILELVMEKICKTLCAEA